MGQSRPVRSRAAQKTTSQIASFPSFLVRHGFSMIFFAFFMPDSCMAPPLAAAHDATRATRSLEPVQPSPHTLRSVARCWERAAGAARPAGVATRRPPPRTPRHRHPPYCLLAPCPDIRQLRAPLLSAPSTTILHCSKIFREGCSSRGEVKVPLGHLAGGGGGACLFQH